MTRLSDIATVESGTGFPISEQGRSGETFPFLKVSDMNLAGNEIEIKCWNHSVSETARHRLRARSFPAGTVIFPKIGAAIGTNKKRLLTCPSCIDNNCMGVTGDTERVEPWYLYYLFRAKDISDFASASNPPSIRKTEVEGWEVRVPSLLEQRRIVDLLSRAESIVHMRREAETKAKEIIPALFLDMFGDPARNERGWPQASLGSLLVDGPKNGLYKHASLYGEGTPILRIDSFYGGAVDDMAKLRRVRISDEEKKGFALQPGDIVINRVNSPEYLGKSTIVPIVVEPTVFESNMMRLRLNTEMVLPEYVIQLLQFASMRRALIVNAKHAINQSSINQTDVKGLQLVVPPVAVQETFVARVRAILGMAKRQCDGSLLAGAAFQSLLHAAFGEG